MQRTPPAPFNTGAYIRITDVQRAGDTLRITFENGDVAQLRTSQLVPPETAGARWDAMTWEDLHLAIPVEGRDEPIYVPWSTIRAITDPRYATYMAEVAKRQAASVGGRIAALRRARGLTSKELAQRAGISPISLSRIERGHHDVVYSTLAPILAAMGCTTRDLIAYQPLKPASRGTDEPPAASEPADPAAAQLVRG